MNLEKLVDVVQTMILEHDYPGFEPRALKLGLPDSVNNASAKVFCEALGHPDVYVKLAALRWFQEKPGMGKGYSKAIAGMLDAEDPFVRREATHALDKLNVDSDDVLAGIAALLKDGNVEVRKDAARALGKLCSRRKNRSEASATALRAAVDDENHEVRWKVQKALRLMGEYKD
jgi:vesicle coat complex subunit